MDSRFSAYRIVFAVLLFSALCFESERAHSRLQCELLFLRKSSKFAFSQTEERYAVLKNAPEQAEPVQILASTQSPDGHLLTHTLRLKDGAIQERVPDSLIKFQYITQPSTQLSRVLVFLGNDFGLRQLAWARVLGEIVLKPGEFESKSHIAVLLEVSSEIHAVPEFNIYQEIEPTEGFAPTPNGILTFNENISPVSRVKIIGQRSDFRAKYVVVDYGQLQMEVISESSLYATTHRLVGKSVSLLVEAAKDSVNSGQLVSTIGKVVAARSVRGEDPEFVIELSNKELVLRQRNSFTLQ